MSIRRNPLIGVYVITIADGRKYVGASTNIARRYMKHRSDLRMGRHPIAAVQAAWDADPGGVVFETHRICEVQRLSQTENECIVELKPKLNRFWSARNIWRGFVPEPVVLPPAAAPARQPAMRAVRKPAPGRLSQAELRTAERFCDAYIELYGEDYRP